jgi:hypothetical protein
MVMAAYGCELSWRRTIVAWMMAALLRGYRGDNFMVDGWRCYGVMYLYRQEGGWFHDKSNLVTIIQLCLSVRIISYLFSTLTLSFISIILLSYLYSYSPNHIRHPI